jgi:hypothetical protein
MVCWSLPLREEHITTRNPPLPPVSFPLNMGSAREIHLRHGEILIVFLTSRYDLVTTTRCCSKPSMVDYWCDRVVADSLSWFVIVERSICMASIWAQYFWVINVRTSNSSYTCTQEFPSTSTWLHQIKAPKHKWEFWNTFIHPLES